MSAKYWANHQDKILLLRYNFSNFSNLSTIDGYPDALSGHLTGDCGEVKTVGIYTRKKVLLITHLPISPIPNAAELMTHLEIQGCLDDSSSDCDIAVTSKRLLFHRVSLLVIIIILF